MGGLFGRAVIVALAVLAVAGCGAAPDPSTSLPTFPTAASGAERGAGEGPGGTGLPEGCEQLLASADLGAVLGLPLDSVTSRTTVHVPQPSVGRTERVACRYSGAGSVRGNLVDLDVSLYSSAEAALQQWRVNSDAEDGQRREVPLGGASAVLVERSRDAVLRVVHGSANITILLPDRPLPAGRSRSDTLVDLALRVLPVVSPEAAAPEAAAPTRAAADTQS